MIDEKDTNLDLNIAIVFKGKLSTLRKVEDLLYEEKAWVIYVEKGRKKLFIKKENELEGEADDRNTETVEE